MKDNFSSVSSTYARFRPGYPEELYAFVLDQVPDKGIAWDCATGNGQAAVRIARDFRQVEASDLSANQLSNAPKVANVHYTVCRAEKTPYPDHHFDLVTVAQALHWFHFADFFAEVKRVARPGAVFAAWTYDICEAPPTIQECIQEFYREQMRPWFDDERSHIDDRYGSIPFPFEMMEAPLFYLPVSWDMAHVAGFLESWSAVQHYMKAKGESPVPAFMAELAKVWPEGQEKVDFRFPLTLKIGRVGG